MKSRLSGFAFLSLTVIASAAWLAYYSTGTLARAAQTVMLDEVARGNFSGVVLIRRDGKTIFEKAYGSADVDRGIPNTTNTRFEIGSITKPFTAVLVLQLEQEKRLSLEDPLCHFIVQCPPGWADIQLRHLLAHTSGIYNFTNTPKLESLVPIPQTHAQIVARFIDEPLAFRAGTQHAYSNSNYYLLGMIIEKVSGQSYETVLRQRILRPLQMNATGMSNPATTSDTNALGYRRDARGRFIPAFKMDESWSYAAGAIHSTVGDLAKFSDALAGEKLLSRAALEKMWQPVMGQYGLGWETPAVSEKTFNRRVVEHGGRMPGFCTRLRRFVDEGLTIIVLSNRLETQPERVANGLSAVMFGQRFKSVFDRSTIELSAELRERYSGVYEFGGKEFTLFDRDGQLFARSEEWPEMRVFAEAEDELYVSGMEGGVFPVEDSYGKLIGLSITMSNGSTRLARKLR